jgi:hypothetical protein
LPISFSSPNLLSPRHLCLVCAQSLAPLPSPPPALFFYALSGFLTTPLLLSWSETHAAHVSHGRKIWASSIEICHPRSTSNPHNFLSLPPLTLTYFPRTCLTHLPTFPYNHRSCRCASLLFFFVDYSSLSLSVNLSTSREKVIN